MRIFPSYFSSFPYVEMKNNFFCFSNECNKRFASRWVSLKQTVVGRYKEGVDSFTFPNQEFLKNKIFSNSKSISDHIQFYTKSFKQIDTDLYIQRFNQVKEKYAHISKERLMLGVAFLCGLVGISLLFARKGINEETRNICIPFINQNENHALNANFPVNGSNINFYIDSCSKRILNRFDPNETMHEHLEKGDVKEDGWIFLFGFVFTCVSTLGILSKILEKANEDSDLYEENNVKKREGAKTSKAHSVQDFSAKINTTENPDCYFTTLFEEIKTNVKLPENGKSYEEHEQMPEKTPSEECNTDFLKPDSKLSLESLTHITKRRKSISGKDRNYEQKLPKNTSNSYIVASSPIQLSDASRPVHTDDLDLNLYISKPDDNKIFDLDKALSLLKTLYENFIKDNKDLSDNERKAPESRFKRILGEIEKYETDVIRKIVALFKIKEELTNLKKNGLSEKRQNAIQLKIDNISEIIKNKSQHVQDNLFEKKLFKDDLKLFKNEFFSKLKNDLKDFFRLLNIEPPAEKESVDYFSKFKEKNPNIQFKIEKKGNEYHSSKDLYEICEELNLLCNGGSAVESESLTLVDLAGLLPLKKISKHAHLNPSLKALKQQFPTTSEMPAAACEEKKNQSSSLEKFNYLKERFELLIKDLDSIYKTTLSYRMSPEFKSEHEKFQNISEDILYILRAYLKVRAEMAKKEKDENSISSLSKNHKYNTTNPKKSFKEILTNSSVLAIYNKNFNQDPSPPPSPAGDDDAWK